MFIGKKLFKIIFIFKAGNDDGFVSDTVTAGGFERSRIFGVEVKFYTVEGLVLRFIILDEVVEGEEAWNLVTSSEVTGFSCVFMGVR